MSLMEAGFARVDEFELRPFTKESLKDEFQRHLNDARREGASNGAESTAAGGGIRRLEVGLVHQVEKLRAEFELADLRPKREVLVQAKIGLVDGIAPDRVAPGVPERVGVERVQCDLATDNDRSGTVPDGPQDRGCFKLRPYGDGQCGEQYC